VNGIGNEKIRRIFRYFPEKYLQIGKDGVNYQLLHPYYPITEGRANRRPGGKRFERKL